MSDRVDLGVWGSFNPQSTYGMAGADAMIALMRQGPGRPVSVSIRPSISTLIGPSEVWAGNAAIDLSVSRAIGPVSPYVGVVTSGTVAVERSVDVDLRPVTANQNIAFAGISYRWNRLVLSAEVEKGREVSFGFRVGTRF